MKIMHVFLDQKAFTESVIPFLQDNFRQYNFRFCVYNKFKKGEYNTKKMEGIQYYCRKNLLNEIKLMKKLLEENDVVFFHSLSISPIARIALSVYNKLIKKIVWIAYGYDLYYEKINNGFCENLKYLIKRIASACFNKKIPNFVAIHDVDKIQYDKTVFGNAAKHGIMYYTSNQSLPSDVEICGMTNKKTKNEPICIQVGHRAEPYLKHIDTLNKLSRFKNENIQVILPLSYGDLEYGKLVAERAKSIFGKKSIILQDFMPYNEYMKLLNSVDILVLNSKRQIALGNIHRLLSLGKKIYIPKDSILFEYYKKNNVPVFDLDSLDSCTFDELTADADSDAERSYIKKLYGIDVVKCWDEMFKNVLNNIHYRT